MGTKSSRIQSVDPTAAAHAAAKAKRTKWIQVTVERVIDVRTCGDGRIDFGRVLNRLKTLSTTGTLLDTLQGDNRKIVLIDRNGSTITTSETQSTSRHRKVVVQLTNRYDYDHVQELTIPLSEFQTVVHNYINVHVQQMQDWNPGLFIQYQGSIERLRALVNAL